MRVRGTIAGAYPCQDRSVPAPLSPSARGADARVASAWAASGAMALTGRVDGPALGPPARLVDGVADLGRRIATASAALGTPVELDWLALLGERAALAGLGRQGAISCGGATRLLPSLDGWVAVSLARPDDLDLLPAWLGTEPAQDPWPAVAAAVARRSNDELLAGAALLGLPVGGLGERTADDGGGVRLTELAPAPPCSALSDVVVLDLSGLWAGPLCASLLGAAGAAVVKVESWARPDGARRGDPGFYALLNAGKRSVALDLARAEGRAALAALVAAADVVVEAARPRALEQLGIAAADALRAPRGPRVWVSITGHGRPSGRVAFGDDAAVAGGLVATDEAGPCFCADAVADPLSGLAAAAAALEALRSGGRWLVDVALAGVSASFASPTLAALGEPAPPRARAPRGVATPLGADTATVLAAR